MRLDLREGVMEMDKDFDDFLHEVEHGVYAEDQDDLVRRYHDPDAKGRSGDQASTEAIEYARAVVRLTLREYHEWIKRRP